jgi:transcriptional regulator with XRE-family HTH domain
MSKRRQPKPNQIVGGILRALREEAGLTQRALGLRLAKPQSWVYNCEQGQRRVVVEEFVAWAVACGIDPKSAFERALRGLEL